LNVEESILVENDSGGSHLKGWYIFFTDKEPDGRALRVARLRIGAGGGAEGMEVREPGEIVAKARFAFSFST
jgi:hypothetical protein